MNLPKEVGGWSLMPIGDFLNAYTKRQIEVTSDDLAQVISEALVTKTKDCYAHMITIARVTVSAIPRMEYNKLTSIGNALQMSGDEFAKAQVLEKNGDEIFRYYSALSTTVETVINDRDQARMR